MRICALANYYERLVDRLNYMGSLWDAMAGRYDDVRSLLVVQCVEKVCHQKKCGLGTPRWEYDFVHVEECCETMVVLVDLGDLALPWVVKSAGNLE